jgi:hypothetical protein
MMPAVGFNLANLNLGQWAVIGLSVALGAWFLAGIAVNRKAGRGAHAWLASALEGYSCGELRWVDLATAAVVLKAGRTNLPLDRIEAIFALERRENCPLWLFQHAAGKRDNLILRAALRKKPGFEAHLVPSREYAVISSLTQGRDPPLTRSEESGGYSLFVGGGPDAATVQTLKALADRFKGSIQRVSLRADNPQLLFHVRLAALRAAPAGSLLQAIDELARGF